MKDTLFFWRSANSFNSLNIVVDPEANQNSAIAVDLVFVYDQTLVSTLSNVNASQWFEGKTSYRLNYPNGFDTVSWELVPGQSAPKKPFPAHKKDAIGIFIFANYSTTDEEHRARIDTLEDVNLFLGKTDFTIHSGQL